MNPIKITQVSAREILDSRGYPTLEAEITVASQPPISAAAAVPSGASTGSHEAFEKRDGGSRFFGKGVLSAAENVNGPICKALQGVDVLNQSLIDNTMITLDNTKNKERLGANALLSVSLAASRAAAAALSVPLYGYLGNIAAKTLPTPMMNVFNGGVHASNNIDIQEFMVMPVGAKSFREAVRQCSEIYHALQGLLKQKGLSVSVGDEGGFAADLADESAVLELLCDAISACGLVPGKDVVLALDAAAADWVQADGSYLLPKKQQRMTQGELLDFWTDLTARYPIRSLEDPLGEDDFEGWTRLTAALGHRLQLVGDDLFTTSRDRLYQGIEKKAGNAILIKPNQIGTLTETLSTICAARGAGFEFIISHRSGETEDPYIADLSVGFNANQIKTGAPCRGERTAKYNRLMKIELELGKTGVYAGRTAFERFK